MTIASHLTTGRRKFNMVCKTQTITNSLYANVLSISRKSRVGLVEGGGGVRVCMQFHRKCASRHRTGSGTQWDMDNPSGHLLRGLRRHPVRLKDYEQHFKPQDRGDGVGCIKAIVVVIVVVVGVIDAAAAVVVAVKTQDLGTTSEACIIQMLGARKGYNNQV